MSRRQTHTTLNRRRFVQASAALGGPVLAGASQANGNTLEGFAEAPSVKAGQWLSFRVRNPQGSFDQGQQVPVTFTRLGWPDRDMGQAEATVYNEQVLPDAATSGCRNWRVALRVAVPWNCPTGLYWATFGTGASACKVPVVVRPPNRRPGVAVLVQVPVTTSQAYNPYGGKSLYEYNSDGGVRASQVSFFRPYANHREYAFDHWQPPFIRWLEKRGIDADYCTSLDLHLERNLLNGYRMFATGGHDEYWSRAMRDRVDAFVALGGNLAIFSGDTCYWQVRFEGSSAESSHMVCHKSIAADPGGTPATKTGQWEDLAPPHPQASTTGLSFENGATWTNRQPRPETPFVVHQPEHWVFEGTGLGQGAAFGAGLVGYETDAAHLRWGADGRPQPTGRNGTPATLRVLAQADCSDWNARAKALGLSGEKSGAATVSVFSRGGGQGTVFNVGITDWVLGLKPELEGAAPTAISTITANVFRRLSQAHLETVDVRLWRAAAPGNAGSCYYTLGVEAPPGCVLDGLAFRALAGPAAGSRPAYRWRAQDGGANGQRWLLSYSDQAASHPGWTLDGLVFHVYPGQVPNSRPVYQWLASDASGLDLWAYGHQAPPVGNWQKTGLAFHAPLA